MACIPIYMSGKTDSGFLKNVYLQSCTSITLTEGSWSAGSPRNTGQDRAQTGQIKIAEWRLLGNKSRTAAIHSQGLLPFVDNRWLFVESGDRGNPHLCHHVCE
jgi:hypothetical protein